MRARALYPPRMWRSMFLIFVLCIPFLAGPSRTHAVHKISGEKEIDFAEQLESVAYVLCGEGSIVFEKFVSIWKARGVSR